MCTTAKQHTTPATARRSPLTPRISRTVHAPASRRASNNERVATYAQNFEDAPRASVTTCGKQREGRHLRPEFRGRSTRQRHDIRPEDQKTTGPEDQRTAGPEDQKTGGRSPGPEDQRTTGPSKPEDQRTRRPEDQRTTGPEDPTPSHTQGSHTLKKKNRDPMKSSNPKSLLAVLSDEERTHVKCMWFILLFFIKYTVLTGTQGLWVQNQDPNLRSWPTCLSQVDEQIPHYYYTLLQARHPRQYRCPPV